tara:strand:+ start:74 stop:478 length:405 start_codon:yes stop_codon:yes gene_type:complete
MFSLENTYFSKLPEELIDYIWKLNEYGAACVINYYARKYFKNFSKELKPLIHFSHFEAKLNLGMINFDYFIFGKQRNKNDIFNKLSACNCCKKHQTNKPKKLEPWFETQFHDTQHRECNCICRHYTRWLCRHID